MPPGSEHPLSELQAPQPRSSNAQSRRMQLEGSRVLISSLHTTLKSTTGPGAAARRTSAGSSGRSRMCGGCWRRVPPWAATPGRTRIRGKPPTRWESSLSRKRRHRGGGSWAERGGARKALGASYRALPRPSGRQASAAGAQGSRVCQTTVSLLREKANGKTVLNQHVKGRQRRAVSEP